MDLIRAVESEHYVLISQIFKQVIQLGTRQGSGRFH